jgi:type IV pilus assembly protein PilM
MKPFLAIDAGAANLKVALFEPRDNGTLVLSRYEVLSLGQRGLEETDRTDLLTETLKAMLDRHEIRAKGMEANICAPSYQCFTKFLRTPVVEGSKVGQIVQYEAASQVPFPLDEVEWGYQPMGESDTGELDVMLMALKDEIIESLSTVCNTMGIRLSVVDGSPAALRNAFMHNYAEVEGCSMLLDIGSKTTNVIFIEGDQFFVRSINFGSNAITQEFAKESGLEWAQAEEYKVAYGYVHLTNTEEPTDPYQSILVRTARNVMTRLHQQVAQTIQYYRSQHGGQSPQQIYLGGGGASMIYTAEFFIEKFTLPVEFFNPFRNMEIGPDVERQALAANAHWLGEVSGLGLRATTMGLIEFNLLPTQERISRQIEKRSPYAIAAIFCAGLIFFVQAAANNSVANKKKASAGKIEGELSQFSGVASQVASAEIREAEQKASSEKMASALKSRYYWINLVNGIQGVLSKLEPEVYIVSGPNELAAITNRVDELVAHYENGEHGAKPQGVTKAETAIWIQSLTSTQPTLAVAAMGGSGNPESGMMGPGSGPMGPPPGGMMGGNPEGGSGGGLGGGGFQAVFSGSTEPTEREPVHVVYLKLRAKNVLPRERETQNREYTQLVAKLFRQNEMFSESEDETKVIGAIPNVDSKERWFDFVMQLKLTDSIKLKNKELE